jgi:branched-chain amino acid transport system substrate-binding protein
MNQALPRLALCLALFCAGTAHAEAVIRIGVLTDLSGSMASAAGQGSVEAAQMAVEDASKFLSWPVTVVTGDYQSRADLAEHISEDWIKKQNVDVVVDVPNPGIAARLQDLFREQGRILISSTPRRVDDGVSCDTNSLFWLYDRETLTTNLMRALIAERKQRWFILGSDTPHGMTRGSDAKSFLQQNGGTVVGEAYLGPRLGGLPAIIDQIKASNAEVTLLAFDRPDILHLLKHWPEDAQGAPQGPPLAFPSLLMSDMTQLKDRPVPPFYILTSFYWNQNDAARSFSDRFAQRNHGNMPTSIHASVYSAVLHYLQSVAATNSKETATLLAHMKASALQDGSFTGSRLRGDGVLMHRVNLLLLKAAATRDTPYDYFSIERSMPPAELIPPREAPCPKASAR